MAPRANEVFAGRLETEGLIQLDGPAFALDSAEAALVARTRSEGRAKSISLGRGGAVRHGDDQDDAGAIGALMRRYADWAADRVHALAPDYAAGLQRGRTSLRTRDVSAIVHRPRQDDRRLHIDAFASQPTGGRRILRVFSNINPDGEVRLWNVGEAFEAHARRWIHRARPQFPGEALLLRGLGITRAIRTPYDALMLGLHDAAKLDDAYQAAAPRREVAFAAGSGWMVFTDSTVHAAISGRYALEQTFYLEPTALIRPKVSPLRILERLTGRRLV